MIYDRFTYGVAIRLIAGMIFAPAEAELQPNAEHSLHTESDVNALQVRETASTYVTATTPAEAEEAA